MTDRQKILEKYPKAELFFKRDMANSSRDHYLILSDCFTKPDHFILGRGWFPSLAWKNAAKNLSKC